MRLSSLIPAIILAVLFLGAGLFFSFKLVQSSSEYNELAIEYANQLTLEKRVFDAAEWAEIGNPEKVEKKLEAAEEIHQESEVFRAEMDLYSIILACCALAFLFIQYILYMRGKQFWRAMTLSVLVVAILYLYTGVSAPMIEVASLANNFVAEIKVPLGLMELDLTTTFPGDIYFFYQSKSAVQVIGLLFNSGSWAVALAILLFTFIIPICKLTLSGILLFVKDPTRSGKLRKVLTYVGKWSMGDVFVVGVFLAIFAMQSLETGVQSSSKALPGLYFFLIYVLLSLISSFLLDKTLKQEGGLQISKNNE